MSVFALLHRHKLIGGYKGFSDSRKYNKKRASKWICPLYLDSLSDNKAQRILIENNNAKGVKP